MTDLRAAAAGTRAIVEERALPEGAHLDPATSKAHLLYMLDQISTGAVSGEKAHRWLGWVQGVVCAYNQARMAEFKQVNR